MQIDTYPFQKRLIDVALDNAPTCMESADVADIASLMCRAEADAVLVLAGDGSVTGIVTEHDLVVKVLAEKQRQGVSCAAEIMTVKPWMMSADRYMYEAAALMIRHNIKHLPVVAAGGVVGMLTSQKLLGLRNFETLVLLGGIDEAETLASLAQAKDEIVKIARALLDEGRAADEIVELISHLHYCILQRGFALAVEELERSGVPMPQVRYCLFLMGSGGRREMLLNPDQDHGLILENYPEEWREEVERYFDRLTKKLVEAYAEIGYPRCRGEVMASNPLWRGRLDEWEERLSRWITVPEPQRVRYSNNFFDFSPLVGDRQLCQQLRTVVHGLIESSPLFLYQLMQLNGEHHVPLGVFGRFVLQQNGEHHGCVTTKQGGALLLVDCLRIFSLEQLLDITSTRDRIVALVERKVLTRDTAEHLLAAFQAFTYLRLRQEVKAIEQGGEPSPYLAPASLTNSERELLKEAFRAAKKLQEATGRHYSRLVG